MITIGSAYRLQRLYRLQILTSPRQWGSLIVSGKRKTLIRTPYSALSRNRPHTPESELCPKMDKGESTGSTELNLDRPLPRVPLALILKACPDILPYCERDPREWRDLVVAAGYVRGMMGISPSAWQEAQELMGPETAAVTVACILQRFSEINSPGGYLRALAGKTALGAFSPGPMVMALLNGGT